MLDALSKAWIVDIEVIDQRVAEEQGHKKNEREILLKFRDIYYLI